MDPPTAEAIQAQDDARMMDEIVDAGDDREAAETLLAAKPPVDIAAALLRLQRARLPAPEDLSDSGPAARTVPDGPRPGFEDTVWFRINAGRNNNADPRWLLPYLCRRGHLTKREIGAIRIFDRETRFEIPRAMAHNRFVAALRKTDDGDPDVAIEPVGDAPEPSRTPRRGPPPGGQRGYARR